MNNSIEIIIVIYQCSLETSITFLSLQNQIRKLYIEYEIVLFNNDNTQKIENSKFIVVNSSENQKLAGAYNFALDRAVKNGKNWILLLDQDTVIPDHYFDELQKFLMSDYSSDLAAIVPILESEGRIISPKRISSFMRFESDLNESGYSRKRINAVNSMSLVNVNFIESIGGFCKDYSFDFLDQWYYNQIFKHKKLVYILPVTTNHESSFVNLEKNVSVKRYEEFLHIENTFIRKELGWIMHLFYKSKLILRGLKQLIKFKNKRYSIVTLLAVFKA
jgi:GT2 family glycosyltransferase